MLPPPFASICRYRKSPPQSTANEKAVHAEERERSCPPWRGHPETRRAMSSPSACPNFRGSGKRFAERPIAIAPRAQRVEKHSGDEDHDRISNLVKKILAGDEDVCESQDGQESGKRIEPHA